MDAAGRARNPEPSSERPQRQAGGAPVKIYRTPEEEAQRLIQQMQRTNDELDGPDQ